MDNTGDKLADTFDNARDKVSDTWDAARETVSDTVDAAFNGSGLEGRNDTGLDTMNARTAANTTVNGPIDTIYNPGMTGAVDVDVDVDVVADRDYDEERTLRLREEQLNVSKDRVQTGEVTVHKDVIEETQSINVPVTREEIVIERRAINDDPTAESVGVDETIRIPVSEEQVHVSKNTVVTGEVDIHKREIHDTEVVSDTVRREEARVDKTGNVTVSGEAIREKDSTFRR